jgi:hypothetical protein
LPVSNYWSEDGSIKLCPALAVGDPLIPRESRTVYFFQLKGKRHEHYAADTGHRFGLHMFKLIRQYLLFTTKKEVTVHVHPHAFRTDQKAKFFHQSKKQDLKF